MQPPSTEQHSVQTTATVQQAITITNTLTLTPTPSRHATQLVFRIPSTPAIQQNKKLN